METVIEPLDHVTEKTEKEKAFDNAEAAKKQTENAKLMIALAIEQVERLKQELEKGENFLKFVIEQDKVKTEKYEMLKIFYDSL